MTTEAQAQEMLAAELGPEDEQNMRHAAGDLYKAAARRAIKKALSLPREVEALDDLQQTEAEYRLMHDRHGDGSQAAGRAWDLMRRAGDRARAALAARQPEESAP